MTFNKNIKTSTLNANSILVYRTGGTGNFTDTRRRPDRRRQLHRDLPRRRRPARRGASPSPSPAPLANDEYEVILKGTGANPITDIAGNPLNGAFTGTFPTGSGCNTGSDFVSQPFTVYSAGQSHLIYVQAPTVRPSSAPARWAPARTRSRPSPPAMAAAMHRRRRPGPARHLQGGRRRQAGRPAALGRPPAPTPPTSPAAPTRR